MKKILVFFFFICFEKFASEATAQTQKLVGDCTIFYKIICSKSVNSDRSVKIVYMRNNESRTDIKTNGFLQSVIYNDNDKTAVMLRELSGEKYMSFIKADSWKKQNEKFEGMTVIATKETKTILNYKCNQVKIVLKNGNIFLIYFYPEIIPSCSENPVEFKNISGLILEYESKGENNQTVVFSATSVNFDPLPYYKFEIPKSGYRILN